MVVSNWQSINCKFVTSVKTAFSGNLEQIELTQGKTWQSQQDSCTKISEFQGFEMPLFYLSCHECELLNLEESPVTHISFNFFFFFFDI